MEKFDLEQYLSRGIESIIKVALKASLKDPKESIFMTQYALASKSFRKIRVKLEEQGEHIPPFLIASITSECNLHCAGCYARANHLCHDEQKSYQMSASEWSDLFEQATNLGIGFILLAGGEPLMRKDVIEMAGKKRNILFPIFTNGTKIDGYYIHLFEKNRNLVPVISIEGNETTTDDRRGKGVYKTLITTMQCMQQNHVLYGVSVTVTKENLTEVMAKEFTDQLYYMGCKVIFYIEYVPVNKQSKTIAPEEAEREYMNERLFQLRQCYEDMLFISFPGDEKTSGGCLAAGRGFFHINPVGEAQPCPFSPFSDTNVKNNSLRDVLHSPLFRKLQEGGVLMEEHEGGCVLFEKEELVKQILKQ